MRLAIVLVAVAACSSSEPPAPAPAPVVPVDAAPIDSGITQIGAFDPASGMHLDDDSGSAAKKPAPATAKRPSRPIEVTLRSTPAGAIAYVDGQQVGPTPAFWQGDANGKEHEFSFTMRGHFTARYRFVPVASGVVHARLERSGADDSAPQPPPAQGSATIISPPKPPIALPSAPPVPPPPTIISPDAAPAQPVDAS